MVYEPLHFSVQEDDGGNHIIGTRVLVAESFPCRKCGEDVRLKMDGYYCSATKKLWCSHCFNKDNNTSKPFTHPYTGTGHKLNHVDWRVDKFEAAKHNIDE